MGSESTAPKCASAHDTPMSAADIYANARALSGYLREQSAAIDEARKLPAEVVTRLREGGMFRLMMPKEWGGPELRPSEQVEIIEELAKANASAAWCVMIGCDSGFFAGYLDEARRARNLPAPRHVHRRQRHPDRAGRARRGRISSHRAVVIRLGSQPRRRGGS